MLRLKRRYRILGKKILKWGILLLLLLGLRKNTLKINRQLMDYNLEHTIGFNAIAKKNKEVKEVPVLNRGNFIYGYLTGYGADCPLCGGTLACKPSYNVYKNGVVTYPDLTYGNVRIVASSKNLKCGSIIKFNSSRLSSETIYAIVLDRGVGGNNLDLLMQSEQEAANKVGRSRIAYTIVRNGW